MNFVDLLSSFALSVGVSAYYIGETGTSVTPFFAEEDRELCRSCIYRGNVPFCPQLMSLPPGCDIHRCRMGYSFPVIRLRAGKKTLGLLAAGPLDHPEQAKVSALLNMMESCAEMIRVRNLFPQNKSLFERLDDYVSEHIAEPLTGETLSEALFFSVNTLSRATQRETGLSLGQYVRSKRLESARKLLETTELSIRDVAGQCGIGDFNYFARLVKKEFGLTPSEIRLRKRMR